MNDLKVFSNSEFGELGVMLIDGKEYFPATQCAKLLGYKDTINAIKQHCKLDGVVKRKGVSYTTNQHGVTTQQTVELKYINEGNLYRLIVSSKLPKAQEFESWIFDEVLPEIRKTGSYGQVNIDEIVVKTATAVVSEVLVKLIPEIKKGMETSGTNIVYDEEPIKKPRRIHCVISCLDKELRKEVDDMILNGNTYKEISDFLAEYGVSISISSVWRYAQRMMNYRSK